MLTIYEKFEIGKRLEEKWRKEKLMKGGDRHGKKSTSEKCKQRQKEI